MENITDVFLTPLPDSIYVKPFRFNYKQDGKKKNWDLLQVHDSVAIIIFNVSRNIMVLVKQFRPAIYFNSIPPEDRYAPTIDMKKYPAKLGIALELCAGIVDKVKSLKEIAKEEVLEECGYDVPLDRIEKVLAYRSGVGVQGSSQVLYYCEVTDEMKVEQGGGVDDEIIEIVEMTIPQIEDMMASKEPLLSPPSCLFGLMWFLANKADQFRK